VNVEADRLQDEFVALVSHELRTPLTSIAGYVELALEEDVSDDVRAYLGVVSRNSERLLALVSDLLFVARLQVGDLPLRPGEVDLADVVREALRVNETRAVAKGVTLTCDLDCLPEVPVDRGCVQHVVDNLVSNAVKFTPSGGAVHLSLARAGDAARIEVADTGIGIAPEDHQHLFQRFFRASNAVEGQIAGAGLGLYISRAIADAHGGRLTVQSRLGEGSTFRFDLPLAA
jgi:signal transduction histidine kinase